MWERSPVAAAVSPAWGCFRVLLPSGLEHTSLFNLHFTLALVSLVSPGGKRSMWILTVWQGPSLPFTEEATGAQWGWCPGM